MDCLPLHFCHFVLEAANRFNIVVDKSAVSTDYMIVTGHEKGHVEMRNIETGKVMKRARHYNNNVVDIVITSSYVYSTVAGESNREVDNLTACSVFVMPTWQLRSCSRSIV